MSEALAGLKVLDLTRILAGPYCTMILCDLGAEVIKIEHPEGGDLSRGTAPFMDGESYFFVSVNRGKRSMTLDLAHPEGRELFEGMAVRADVVVENFRPGSMDRLGLGYPALREINPRLIYAAISGFGQTGPYVQKPSLDIVAQAMGGIMSITGEPGGPPIRPGSSLGDITAGLFAASAILAALYERDRSGQGQMVDLAMLDCQVAILENAIGRYLLSGQVPEALGTRHPTFTPFQAYQTRDGWIVVAIVGGLNDMWPRLCAAIDRVELIDDSRFQDGHTRTQNFGVLNPILTEAFRQKDSAQWLEELGELGIPCGPVNTIDQVVTDPQVRHREMLVEVAQRGVGPVTVVNSPIKMSRTPGRPSGPGAALGEHNRWVLANFLGLDEEGVARVEASGALGGGGQSDHVR